MCLDKKQLNLSSHGQAVKYSAIGNNKQLCCQGRQFR